MSPSQRWLSLFIVAVALAFRVFALDLKPAHFDEGVNGTFVVGMLAEGCYRYDPANYHGPLHFYVLFIAQQLFGKSLWVARMPTVLIGTGTVALMLAFGRFMPWRVTWIAALAAAISPAMVFYSRYAIHEAWLPFFTVLAIYGGLGIARGERRMGDLWSLGLGLAGMVLTKETYIVHWCAAGAAIAMTKFLDWYAPVEIVQRSRPVDLFSSERTSADEVAADHTESPGLRRFGLRRIALVTAGCAALVVLFYSGFGMHWPGVTGMLDTFRLMFAKGTTAEAGHNKEFFYWLKLLAYYEWPALLGLVAAPMLCLRRSPMLATALLVGGALIAAPGLFAQFKGSRTFSHPDYLAPQLAIDSITSLGVWILVCSFSLFAAVPARSREVRWLCLYGLASFTAYSLIPYKTPWCIINLVWPLFFALGQFVENLTESIDRRIVYLFSAFIAWTPLSECYRLNFKRPTDDGDRYVYVQTTLEIEKLLDPIRRIVALDPAQRQMRGLVLTDAFPLSWELSDLPSVTYLDHDATPPSYDADFILIPTDREADFEEHLTGLYFKEDCLVRSGGEPGVLYLNAERFFPLFQDRAPEFHPRIPQLAPASEENAK